MKKIYYLKATKRFKNLGQYLKDKQKRIEVQMMDIKIPRGEKVKVTIEI